MNIIKFWVSRSFKASLQCPTLLSLLKLAMGGKIFSTGLAFWAKVGEEARCQSQREENLVKETEGGDGRGHQRKGKWLGVQGFLPRTEGTTRETAILGWRSHLGLRSLKTKKEIHRGKPVSDLNVWSQQGLGFSTWLTSVFPTTLSDQWEKQQRVNWVGPHLKAAAAECESPKQVF